MPHDYPRPVVALIGRPNVGKSTLFNRLTGRRTAVVSPARGTTRDRLYGRVEWRGRPWTLIDMGGMELAKPSGLGEAVQEQIRQARQEADGFVLVCDAQDGLLPADELILESLRKNGKPIVLAVNKADTRPVVAPEFAGLGLAEALPVSALHGRGIGELLDLIGERFGPGQASPAQAPLPPERPVAVAIVGRQNVGKSSLVNALLREERMIVSSVPGTTRDAVDVVLQVDGRPVRLVDTAGLRHRRKVKSPVDFFSMGRTVQALERCDAALLLLDATQGITRDDQRIIARVCHEGCGLALLVNKWDAAPEADERQLTDRVHRALPEAVFAPVIAVSAKTGFQVHRALRLGLRIAAGKRRGLTPQECTALLKRAWAHQTPPRYRGRLIQLKRAHWLDGRPARVEIFTHPIGRLPGPYQHYLLKRLYAHEPLSGIPLRLLIRGPDDS